MARGHVVVGTAGLEMGNPKGDKHGVAPSQVGRVVVHRVSVDVSIRRCDVGALVKCELARVVEDHVGNIAAGVVGQRSVTVVINTIHVDVVIQNAVGVCVGTADLVDTEHVGKDIMEDGPQVGVFLAEIVGGGVTVAHAGVLGVVHEVVLHHAQGVLGGCNERAGDDQEEKGCFFHRFQVIVFTICSASSRRYSMTGCRESLLGVKLK